MAQLTAAFVSSRGAYRSTWRRDRTDNSFAWFAAILSGLLLALTFVAHAHGFDTSVDEFTVSSDVAE